MAVKKSTAKKSTAKKSVKKNPKLPVVKIDNTKVFHAKIKALRNQIIERQNNDKVLMSAYRDLIALKKLEAKAKGISYKNYKQQTWLDASTGKIDSLTFYGMFKA